MWWTDSPEQGRLEQCPCFLKYLLGSSLLREPSERSTHLTRCSANLWEVTQTMIPEKHVGNQMGENTLQYSTGDFEKDKTGKAKILKICSNTRWLKNRLSCNFLKTQDMKPDLICSPWKTSVEGSCIPQFSQVRWRGTVLQGQHFKKADLHTYRKQEQRSVRVKVVQAEVPFSLLIFSAVRFLQSHYLTSYSTTTLEICPTSI